MSLATRSCGFFGAGGIDFARGGKTDAHPGATLAGDFLGGVAQFDAAAMLLHDAPDDGKTESRALFPGRDIRLEQPAAICLRQADAVIDDVDHDVVAITRRVDMDNALAELAWTARAAIASVAFLMMLVSACEIRRDDQIVPA